MKARYPLFFTLYLLIFLSAFPKLLSITDKDSTELESMSLRELMDINVKSEVASIFKESTLKVPSTVSVIKSTDWNKNGVETMPELLNNELGIISYEYFGGHFVNAIRGYGRANSSVGTATLLDGIPLNSYYSGSSMRIVPDWSLGTLNKIEIIKGAGSMFYGSDAFHGVFSMSSFKSDKDIFTIMSSGTSNLFANAAINLSKGFMDNTFRVDFSFSTSSRGSQNIEYYFDDPAYSIYSPPKETIPAQKGNGVRNYGFHNISAIFHLTYNISEEIYLKGSFYRNRYEANGFAGPFNYLRDRDSVNFVNKPGAYHTREKSTAGSRSDLLAGKIQFNYKINELFTLNLSGYKWEGGFVYIREAPVSAINSPLKWEWGYDNSRSGIELSIKQGENKFGLQFRARLSHGNMAVLSETDRAIDRYTGQWKTYESDITAVGKNREINSLELTIRQRFFNSKFYLNLSGRLDDYSNFSNQFSPSIAAIFLPTDTSSIKFLFSKAFRAPSADEQIGHFNIKGNSKLNAELIDFYELTYLIQKNKSEYKLNGFYSTWYNGIMFATVKTDNGFRKQNQNLGNNYSYGLETELKLACKNNSMHIGFSYVKSFAKNRILDNKNMGNIGYTLYPRYSIIANFKHKLPTLKLYMRLNNTIYANWTDMDPTTESNVEKLKSYWRTDLVFTRENSKYRFDIHFKNLFNRKNYMPSVVGSLERRNGLEQTGFNVMLSAGMSLNK